jgi:hypothetical protein
MNPFHQLLQCGVRNPINLFPAHPCTKRLLSRHVSEHYYRAARQLIDMDNGSKYISRHAVRSDLPAIHALYSRHFGHEVPSLQLMHTWLDRCPACLTTIHQVSECSGLQTTPELVGSFKLLPLTAKGISALDLRQASGSTLQSKHIGSGRRRPKAYYAGGMVATSPPARAIVVAHLYAACASTAKATTTIYARPLTKSGLQIVTKLGFVQVSDGKTPPAPGQICRLNVSPADPLMQSRIRRTAASLRRLVARLGADVKTRANDRAAPS